VVAVISLCAFVKWFSCKRQQKTLLNENMNILSDHLWFHEIVTSICYPGNKTMRKKK